MTDILDEIMDALIRARDVAMRQSVVARIPECGKFGEIAQDLDWVISMLEIEKKAVGANR